MGDEPRFPPPRGEEPIGYREAGAPISDDKPDLPVPSNPPLPRGRRVVASRPDDFDVALAKAYTPPRRTPRQQASRAGVIVFVLFVLIYVGLELATHVRPKPRRIVPAAVAT